jgi:hypothetical protein
LEALVNIFTVSEPNSQERHGGRVDANLAMRIVAGRALADRLAVEMDELRDVIDGG